MSETNAAETPARDTGRPEQDHTNDGTDWKAEARKWENRAKENKAAADELATLREANKTEAQRLTEAAEKASREAEEWRGKYRALGIKQAILDAATTANTTDAESVYLHLRDTVQLDDDGQPTQLDAAVKALAKRKPHLFRAAPGARDATATTTGGRVRTIDDMIRGR